MGKALSLLSKPVKNYNVEARAHKIISKDKPARAPLHPSSIKEIELMKDEEAKSVEALRSKDSILNENLRSVYVVSHDPVKPVSKSTFGKPSEQGRLPLNRMQGPDLAFGYVEPTNIPAGRISLMQGLQILKDNKENPTLHNVSKIASDYKLKEEDVENILKYFSIHKVEVFTNEPVQSASTKAQKFLASLVQSKRPVAKIEDATPIPGPQIEGKKE